MIWHSLVHHQPQKASGIARPASSWCGWYGTTKINDASGAPAFTFWQAIIHCLLIWMIVHCTSSNNTCVFLWWHMHRYFILIESYRYIVENEIWLDTNTWCWCWYSRNSAAFTSKSHERTAGVPSPGPLSGAWQTPERPTGETTGTVA